MEITSLNNDKVKVWNKLKNKKYQNEYGLFLVEGDHLLKEALKVGALEEIISSRDYETELPFYKVTKDIMKKLSSQVSGTDIIGVCTKRSNDVSIGNKVLVLDNISDPGNMGTIIRSAVAFNIDTIIASNNSVDFYNDKVIRSSEGMFFNIDLIKTDIEEKIKILKSEGFYIMGTDVVSGTNIKDVKRPDKFVLIMGNEGSGISESIRNMCDTLIYIDMNKSCESLNVGVATSILLYELNKGE